MIWPPDTTSVGSRELDRAWKINDIPITERLLELMGLRREPGWARRLVNEVRILSRKVDTLMSLNQGVLNRILAGVASAVEQMRSAATRESAKDARISALETQLAEAGATLAAERDADTAEDLEANTALTNTADALDALLTGPETPETPDVPSPAEAPAVISGETEVSGGAEDLG